jgi:hypothetical protein
MCREPRTISRIPIDGQPSQRTHLQVSETYAVCYKLTATVCEGVNKPGEGPIVPIPAIRRGDPLAFQRPRRCGP